jgi:diacylglycerol kinase family enzyme
LNAPEPNTACELEPSRRAAPPPSGGAPFLRAHAVINLRSGTAMGKSPNELEDILTSAFAEGGRKLTVDVVEPGHIEAKLQEAANGDADAVIAGGGDGTIRTAASHLLNTDKVLGIVPLGTLNRLARDLGIPLDPQEAALALTNAKVTAIDVATVKDRVYLCNSMIGLMQELAEQRQGLRGRSLAKRVAGHAEMLSHIWRSRKNLALMVEDAKEKRLVRVLSLVVSNNSYAEQPGLMLRRPQLDQGRLGVYISKHRTGAAFAGVFLKVLLGRWRGDPAIEHLRARRIVIDSSLPRIKVSNDGDFETLTFPLTYAIRPQALKVLVPPASAEPGGH